MRRIGVCRLNQINYTSLIGEMYSLKNNIKDAAMTDNNSYETLFKNKTMKSYFLILFAVIVMFLLYIFRFYLWIFLYSLIFYVALRPLHEMLLKYVKKRIFSSTLIILIIISLVVIPSMFLLMMLSEQVYDLYGRVHLSISQDILKDIGNLPIVDKFFVFFNVEKFDLGERIISYFKATSMTAFSSLTSIVSFPVNFVIKFFLMMLILFFLFKDAYNLEGAIYRILPFPDDLEMNIVSKMKSVIYVLMLGNLFIMLLQGFMVGLGLFISGVSTPLVWGTLAAILSLIPVIGTTLIWLPASIYLYFTGNYGMAIFVACWCFSWYMILENLVKPVIFGDKLNFHPLLFFFLLLGSIQAFNLPGVIIGPIILSLFYSFWEIYKILDDYMQNKRSFEISDIPVQE